MAESGGSDTPPAGRIPVAQALSALWAGVRANPFWIVFGLVLVAVVVGTRPGSLEVDTKPQIYLNPLAALEASFSAWQTTPALGQGSFQVGLAPVAAAVAALQALGLEPWLSMRVLRLALMLVAAWGAWALGREVVSDQEGGGRWGPRVAALAYVVHPYVVAAGATLPVLWPYALLPWQLLCVVKGMRSGRWLVWGVAFGLATMAMTGQNAGAVPALQLVAFPVVLVWATRRYRRGLRAPLAFTAVAGVVSLALSAFWILPSLSAIGSGSTIVGQSESPEAIAGTSSFSEVIRGLGLWPLYGRSGGAPWVPEQTGFLTHPVVVVAGFALPLLSWVLLRRVPLWRAQLPISLVAVAAVVMVGVHPFGSPSPAGQLWRNALEQVPALGVLRTTNKAGAVLVLGLALALACGTVAGRRPRPRAAVVLGVLLVATLPGWSGGLFISSANVPEYWKEASRDLDAGDGRVWLLPGEDSAAYRWSDPRPDDVGQGLLSRESLVRTTVANSSPQGANLLAALDRRLQEGTLPPAALAPMARYLGVSTLLVRNDLDWSRAGGAAPLSVTSQVTGSQGIVENRTYGQPDAQSQGEPQLVSFDVQEPQPAAALVSARGSLVVAGDGAALPTLAQLGYLAAQPQFRYASDLTPDRLVSLAASGARVLLTDTNRREARVAGRVTEDHGPLLRATEPVTSTWALGAAAHQSVRSSDGWTATSAREGSVFRVLPWASADNAVDGDPSTAWFAGDYGAAVGQVLDVDFNGMVGPGELVVHTVGLAGAAVTAVSVSTDGEERETTAGESGSFAVTLPEAVTRVQIRVEAVRPGSDGNVGISEITVAGQSSPGADAVRTPSGLGAMVRDLSPAQRATVAAAATDVVLSRVGGPVTSAWSEETNLTRDVALPWDNSVRIRGVFSLPETMPEVALDRVAGDRSDIRVTSSSQAFGLPTLRASMAFDGDSGTGWSPAEPAAGQWWQVELARPQEISEVVVSQPATGRQVERVAVWVDGTRVTESRLDPGRNVITLDEPVRAKSVRLVVEAASEPASAPLRVLEVGVGGASVRRTSKQTSCFTAATLDGEPVRLRPAAPVTTRAFIAVDCAQEPRPLGEGLHEWRPSAEWVADTVVWEDAGAAAEATPPVGLSVTPDRWGPGWNAELPATEGESTLSAGVGYDRNWHLTLDGRDLGRPELVDGYAAGWTIPAGGPRQVALTYSPQRSVWVGIAISAVALAASALLLALAAAKRSSARPSPGRHAAADAPASGLASRPRVARLRSWSGVVVWPLLGVFAAGWVGAAAAVAGLVALRRSRTAAWWLALLLWAALPVAWFWQVLPVFGQVTPDLVARTTVAHAVAAAALVVSVIWAFGPVRGQKS